MDRISFTGGGATASAILAALAPTLKPATLELGGKSANIIFEDADLTKSVMTAFFSSVALQSGKRALPEPSTALGLCAGLGADRSHRSLVSGRCWR